MSRGPDVATLLERRLRVAATAAGVSVAITRSDWTRWASATFTGARHVITLAADPAGFDAWLATLPEADLPLRHHLVADMVIVARRAVGSHVEADLEVLTVEDR